MAAASVMRFVGEIKVASQTRSSTVDVSTTLEDIELRDLEVTVVANATVTLPMTFPTGVDEALVISLYSPKALSVTLTNSDVSPESMTIGLKGRVWWTADVGNGFTAISVTNPNTEDVIVEYTMGCQRSAAVIPPFWDE